MGKPERDATPTARPVRAFFSPIARLVRVPFFRPLPALCGHFFWSFAMAKKVTPPLPPARRSTRRIEGFAHAIGVCRSTIYQLPAALRPRTMIWRPQRRRRKTSPSSVPT